MANLPISGLPVLSTPTLTTIFPVVQSGVTSQLSIENLPQAITAITSDSTTVVLDSQNPTIITGMTATPSAGSYLVNFNSQFTVDDTASQTLQAKTDVIALYNELMALPATVTSRSLTYGNGETLTAGVYALTGATTLNGILTLNAAGDPTKQFVFRCTGTFSTSTFSEIVLSGGALSSNVWFVSEGAGSTGADTIFRGSILANQAAVSTGARTTMEGRLLAITGENSIDTTEFTTPTGTSQSTLGSISSFTMFTGTGAVGNAGASVVPQNVGTNAGAITGFGTATVGGSIIPAGAGTVSIFRCGVYVDGVLINNSLRSTTRPFAAETFEFPVILQTIATITTGQTIDIRAYAELGEQTVGPRMSLVMTPILS